MNGIKQILKTARESFDVVDKISYSVCVDANVSEVKILAVSSSSQNSESDSSSEESVQAETSTTDSNDSRLYTSSNSITLSNQNQSDIEEEEEENTPQISSEPKQLVPESEPPTIQKPVEFKPEPKPELTQAKQKEQMFFEFDERGLFENTPVNERKGVDLDIPAFSRKRIKITLL